MKKLKNKKEYYQISIKKDDSYLNESWITRPYLLVAIFLILIFRAGSNMLLSSALLEYENKFMLRNTTNEIFEEKDYYFFSEKDSRIIQKLSKWKNSINRLLCQFQMTNYCESLYIADSVDLLIQFAPVYAWHTNEMELMYDLHKKSIRYLDSFGIRTVTVEAIFRPKNQKFRLTDPKNFPWEMQVTLEEPFYYRENLLNYAIYQIWDQIEFEYLMWIDAHQIFMNPYWWEEAIYKAEKYSAVHLFSSLEHLTSENFTLENHLHALSVVYKVSLRDPAPSIFDEWSWAGNGWLIRKEIFTKVQYILDTCIAGSCDYVWCLANLKNMSSWYSIQEFKYYDELIPWGKRAHQIMGNGSFVSGKIRHLFHERLFDYYHFHIYLGEVQWNILRDLDREDNLILHVINETILNELIEKA